MAYFPKIGPFYDPKNEQEFYGEQDGRLKLRNSRERRDSGNGSSFRRSGSNTSQPEKVNSSGWTDLVQDQGNLFYVEPNRAADPRLLHPAGIRVVAANHSRQNSHGANHSRQNSHSSNHSQQNSHVVNHSQQNSHGANHSRQSSHEHSDKSDSPRQLIHLPPENKLPNNDDQAQQYDLNSSDVYLNRRHFFNDEVRTSHSSLEHSPLVEFHREDRQRQSDGSSQSDHSYTSFSKFLDSNSGPPRTSQRNDSLRKVNGKRGPHMNISQSGKRKSIYMVPNLNNVNDVLTCSGVTLCELLFGIKLCHYKQKARPNGTNIDQVLRDRKVIVQGVLPDTQADICGQIHRGDMLVCLNEADVTWVNIDDLFRHIAQQPKVKLTFQVPLVVGPKQPTPPVTPTRCTPPPHIPLPTPHLPPSHPHSTSHNSQKAPPIPPHIPLRAVNSSPTPATPPPRPHGPHWRAPHQDLVLMTTGETLASLGDVLKRYLFAVMYLTFAGQSEDSKAEAFFLQGDVLYQYPAADSKVTEIRGLFLTLSRLIPDITHNCPTVTSVVYRGSQIHAGYWRNQQDVLLLCLPENCVPKLYLQHVMADLIRMILVLHGDVTRVFRDRELHEQLDQLLGLTCHRLLGVGVSIGAGPHSSPLEPLLMGAVAGVRWLRLGTDDKISCDEILSEYEAQDYLELDEVDPDKRRMYGIIGSCVYYKDYLLCSHLTPEALLDVHVFLRHHSLLQLVARQPLEDLVLWREIYPTHLCHARQPDNPGYREPTGRWFLLVVGMRHFLHCTVLETGSYAGLATGKRSLVDSFLLEQSKTTLAQLDVDDTQMELHCNERLYSEMLGPRLRTVQTERHMNRQGSLSSDGLSPLKSPGKPDSSPRHVPGAEDGDRLSVQSRDGPGMKRQGSRLSYDSNDSSGSNSGISALKLKKKGSSYDVSTLNRSFSERDPGLRSCDIKLTRGLDNLLFHYVNIDRFEGLYVSPTPCELAAVQGTLHELILYNFYRACLIIHNTFERHMEKQKQLKVEEAGNRRVQKVVEEAVMFACQVGNQSDTRRPPVCLMYWVIGRLYGDKHEMFVCMEDGAPQSMLELAFRFNFGVS